MKYKNPVIKGFNPDPSICRVGEDFYLVTSTFEFFPGVPIYHSKNLVEWELINYCLVDDEQLNLKNSRCSGGIYAPTIRYHNGMFYMTTTNVSNGGNFIVKTQDIYGKWSKPIWIKQGGIDPSLLFDEDKVYFCSTHHDEDGKECIGLCEIDIETGDMLTKTKIISYGTGGRHCEAPHIYKIGEYYYLMTAEGGTEYGHSSEVLRSKTPYGPYVSSPYKSVVGHRKYGDLEIQAVGHSDIIEDQNGNWWCVSLGIRPLKNNLLHNLGRETFLSPVKWTEDKWPIAGNKGKISIDMEGNLPAKIKGVSDDFIDNFIGDKLNLNWNFVRNPKLENYVLKDGLTMFGDEQTLNDDNPTFIGIRQKEFEMNIQTKLEICKNENGKAGLSAFYNKAYHYDVYIENNNDENNIVYSQTIHGVTTIMKKVNTNKSLHQLMMKTNQEKYSFYYYDNEWKLIGESPTAGLYTEGTMMMTFTGTYIGLFADNTTAKFRIFKALVD